MDIEAYRRDYESSWLDEDVNSTLKKNEIVYTPKGIFDLGNIEFVKFPEFNSGYELVQRMDKHIFVMGLRDQSHENLEKLYPQIKSCGGEIIRDLTYGTNNHVVIISDITGLGPMFLNYVKLYKLLKGLKHYYTKRFYRILHPTLLELNDKQKKAINKELRPLRAKLNEYNEIVVTQPEVWDALIIPGVKYCIAKALGETKLKVENTTKFGIEPSKEQAEESLEAELEYFFIRRGEIDLQEEEIQEEVKATKTKTVKKTKSKSKK